MAGMSFLSPRQQKFLLTADKKKLVKVLCLAENEFLEGRFSENTHCEALKRCKLLLVATLLLLLTILLTSEMPDIKTSLLCSNWS